MPRRARVLSGSTSNPRIVVVAAALLDADHRVLIAARPAGKHMAGRWEFPGGKIAAGESPETALRRELREELGIDVQRCQFEMTLVHAYPDREVELLFYVVEAWGGTPQSLDGQALRWVPVEDLAHEDILEADLPFIRTLQQRVDGAR
ncbi:MAG: 8-oxo-dGTP diphosphatase MutT [Steroidobacteraceae bacterium]